MTTLPEILVKHKGKTLDAATIIAIVNEACTVPDLRLSVETVAPMPFRGFVFAVERYDDCLDELKGLHAAHWLETEKYRHSLPLDPDYLGFLRMEMAGQLLLFTIRKDGELVGQSTMKLNRSMHSQTMVAHEDSLFLRADQRGNAFVMLSFIKYGLGVMEGFGVREVRLSSKLINGADKLMVRAGFTPFALQLVKMLGAAKHETETQVAA